MNSTLKITADQFHGSWNGFRTEVKKLMVGNDEVIDLVGVALFSDGHILLQSVPGLGKTVLGLSLASAIKGGEWGFFPFTADLLPSDVKGSEILDLETNKLKVKFGAFKPSYNIFVADEINRATPKTVGSLLAIMEERKVVIGDQVFPVADPSLVLGTQNPIEQEGTYPLPEAMLDRFAVMGRLDYLTADDEYRLACMQAIYTRDPQKTAGIVPVLSPEDIVNMRQFVTENVRITESMTKYLVSLIRTTRPQCSEFQALPEKYRKMLMLGGSQRSTKWLTICSKAAAALRGSDVVTARDVQSMLLPCLGHKIILEPSVKLRQGLQNVEADIFDAVVKAVPVAKA